MALTADNKLYGWGKSSRGQLGYQYRKGKNENHIRRPMEIKICGDRTIRRIACGSLYSLAMVN